MIEDNKKLIRNSTAEFLIFAGLVREQRIVADFEGGEA